MRTSEQSYKPLIAILSQMIPLGDGSRRPPSGCSALLLATGTRPALLALVPWYDGPRAAAVASEVGTATAAISRRRATVGAG